MKTVLIYMLRSIAPASWESIRDAKVRLKRKPAQIDAEDAA
jgi:hypothetical protein